MMVQRPLEWILMGRSALSDLGRDLAGFFSLSVALASKMEKDFAQSCWRESEILEFVSWIAKTSICSLE